MSRRLLILTAGFGEGHNAAARAIEAAWVERNGPGTARVADVIAEASPLLGEVSRAGYLQLINRAPAVWSALYRWIDGSRMLPRLLGRLPSERRVLARHLEDLRPDAICSTYPVNGFILNALFRQGVKRLPHFSIVTDSISINSLWWGAAADAWFLPNDDSAEVLQRAGVAAERLHVLGFPVKPVFAKESPGLHAPPLALGARPRVLHIINSGRQHAFEIARRLMQETDWEITCTAGRDDGLRRRILALASGRRAPAQVLGWTNDIPRLLLTHHVVVSKAGGATTQEALAARCPMVVNQIVPGQEEGNFELLRRHGIGALAVTPDEVLATLRKCFADSGLVCRQWRAAIDPLCRPAAAYAIAERMEALIAAGGVACAPPEPRLAIAA